MGRFAEGGDGGVGNLGVNCGDFKHMFCPIDSLTMFG